MSIVSNTPNSRRKHKSDQKSCRVFQPWTDVNDKLLCCTPALPRCLSPLSASWRTTTSTAASFALYFLLVPLSTWMALPYMRPWQPSLSLKSTTTSWTLDRSSPSGRIRMSKMSLLTIDLVWTQLCSNYIYAFSRRFKATYSAFRLNIYCQYMCSLGIEPTTFSLLTQCSTTEPQEHN